MISREKVSLDGSNNLINLKSGADPFRMKFTSE